MPPPIQQFQQPQSSFIEVIPSLSFTTSAIPTQQLLPTTKDATDFRPKPLFNGPHTSQHLSLPLRPAQQFTSFQTPLTSLNTIDPVALSEQSRGRNRVFRHQDLHTGNFGLNSVNENFPPIYPILSSADSQLQNLLVKSGLNAKNEDFALISKVLSLNHGIQTGSSHYYPIQQARFVRSISPKQN